MSILVTGGTGFIGSQVVRSLLEEGEEDIAVFDLNPSTRLLTGVVDQIELIRGDLGNFSQVLHSVKTFRPKAIYHIGGMLSAPSDVEPTAAFHANAMGTFHVLESAKLFDVPQVLFSSTIGTYGYDIREEFLDDYTLQRPMLFYGATKVFSEHMGLFYRRKYGLDFRGLRYPAIVGPGVKTPGVVQYTSWVIEESAKGNPYTIYVSPDTRCPILYYKDAALALIKLAAAPVENIKMVNYILAGITPVPSAREWADMVTERIPRSQIKFDPDHDLMKVLDKLLLPIDDRLAREEWNWRPEFNGERIVDDFLDEINRHPERYV